jgi:hypothetical protein
VNTVSKTIALCESCYAARLDIELHPVGSKQRSIAEEQWYRETFVRCRVCSLRMVDAPWFVDQ